MLRSKANNVHASDVRRPAWVRQQTDQTHLMCSLSERVPHGRIAREKWNLSGCPWRSLTGWLIPWSVLRPPTPSCPCPPSASPHSVCITRPKQREHTGLGYKIAVHWNVIPWWAQDPARPGPEGKPRSLKSQARRVGPYLGELLDLRGRVRRGKGETPTVSPRVHWTLPRAATRPWRYWTTRSALKR
jgi:hypothetical protein